MKKLKTKVGTLYYEKAHKDEPFKYVLLDSNKNFITNVYNKDYLEALENAETIGDQAELLESCYYSRSLQGLLEMINEDIEDTNQMYSKNEELFTLEDLIDNEYLNNIGDYYIFLYD